MSRALDDLSPAFRPLAFELLARCVEQNIPVMIVDTLRTQAEHEANLARGVSWTKKSKHLTGDAIDICPYELFTIARGGDKLAWNAPSRLWQQVGEIGERVGLRWGGRWTQKDYGHFELPEDDVAPFTSVRA